MEETMTEPQKESSEPENKINESIVGYLDPISDAEPAGSAAKFEPAYEELRTEMLKLDSPRAEEVNWKLAAGHGEMILTAMSKDVLVASYLALSWYRLQGLEGLRNGLMLVTATIETFWETLFPPLKRKRGRMGALAWLIDKVGLALTDIELPSSDRPILEEVLEAVEKLDTTAREKFEEGIPGMRVIKDAIDALLISMPVPQAPEPPAPEKEPEASPDVQEESEASPEASVDPQEAPQPIQTSAPAPQAPAPPPKPVPEADLPQAPAAALDAPEQVVQFLRTTGTPLIEAATMLRNANPADPMAYRLMRVGLWLHLSAPPPVNATGCTQVPVFDEGRLKQLDTMRSSANWAGVLDEAESSIKSNRFNLGLQYRIAEALRNLGPTYAAARRAVNAEVGCLLQRIPDLQKLLYVDGSPMADESTKMWLDEEVMATGSSSTANTGSSADVIPEDTIKEAKDLLGAGNTAEAIALFQVLLRSAQSGRERFVVRLTQADLCRKAGATHIAQALYEGLDEEAADQHIAQWEPELVVQCLVGYISCMRIERKQENASDKEASLYRRLAQLNPSLAIDLGE